MYNIDNFLFSKKEMYLLEHNKQGRSIELAQKSHLFRRKKIYENMHLIDERMFAGGGFFPQLHPYNGSVDFELVSFVDRKKHSGTNEAVHFFLDDYRFRYAVWSNLEKTTESIFRFDYVFTPDFSLWVDLPTEYFNIMNIFRTRYVGAYWQQCGLNVIPTVSWGNANSFHYAFCGLPQHSVLAVCGVGNKHCPASLELWKYAIKQIDKELLPTMIIVFGEEVEIPGINAPIKFVSDYISTHFRK
jgi:hypothetical protein